MPHSHLPENLQKVFQKHPEFKLAAPGHIEFTSESHGHSNVVMGAISRIKRSVIGKTLHIEEAPHQTISNPVALAVFASDSLSSVAYATQEILYILALAGPVFFSLSLPIAAIITVLLIILTTSYRQTIFAYPGGGGAYIVSRDNLGEHAATVAGGALLVDYILTVAVSIASGVAQITSAIPELYDYKILLSLILIAVMTIANLRGVKESGKIFAIPTYFFVVTILATIAVGFYRQFTGSLSQVSGVELEHTVFESISLFLILRAFSSGCAALTGVEAISNGLTAFKEPRSKNAAKTIVAMAGILGVMFIGITFLANWTHALPLETETVISQLGRTIFGNMSLMYYTIISATTVILVMAANTSYADFPRLAALLAGDGFLPKQLSLRGERLVFTWGILTLASAASLLVIIFNASTSQLIPLYAIGVFLSFTMSQTGMVMRWLKVGKLKPSQEKTTKHGELLKYDRHWRLKMLINATGAIMTGIVMSIFGFTKFTEGAWIVIIIIPLLVVLLFKIKAHYESASQALTMDKYDPEEQKKYQYHTVLVLISNVHQGSMKAISYAKALKADQLLGIYVDVDRTRTEVVLEKWEKYLPDLPLVILDSPYRQFINPIIDLVKTLQYHDDQDRPVTVVVPEYVPLHWWENLLHAQAAFRLKSALLFSTNAVVVDVPYHPQIETSVK